MFSISFSTARRAIVESPSELIGQTPLIYLNKVNIIKTIDTMESCTCIFTSILRNNTLIYYYRQLHTIDSPSPPQEHASR